MAQNRRSAGKPHRRKKAPAAAAVSATPEAVREAPHVPALPLPRRPLLIGGALAFGLPLALYMVTCGRHVGPVDSGALIVAAATGGVAHPPGFPLFLLLGRVFSWIPFGSVAFRLNAFSAVTSAVAAFGIYTTALVLFSRSSRCSDGRQAVLWALAAALLCATAITSWEWATIAEVYGLSSMLIAFVLWAVVSWHASAPHSRERDRWLVAIGALGGLGAANHSSTFALLGLAAVCSIGIARLMAGPRPAGRTRARDLGNLCIAAAATLPGLSLYFYLLLAARHDSGLNWGNPATLEALKRHVSGWQYQSFFSETSLKAGANTFRTEFVPLVIGQWGAWWLLLGLPTFCLGVVGLWRDARRTLGFLLLFSVLNIVAGCMKLHSDDKSSLFAPFVLVMGLIVIAGFREAALAARGAGQKATRRLVVTLAFALTVAAALANYNERDRSADDSCERFVKNVVAELPTGSTLLTAQWQVFYPPFLYMQELEGFRTDLEVWDVRMMNRQWYLERVLQRSPAVAALVKVEWDTFRPLLEQFERGHALDPEFARSINDASNAFMAKLFAVQRLRHPIYLTNDVAYRGTYRPDWYDTFHDLQLKPGLGLAQDANINMHLVPLRLVIQAIPGAVVRLPDLTCSVASLDVGDLFTRESAIGYYRLRLRDQEYLEVLRRRVLFLFGAQRIQDSFALLDELLAKGETGQVRETQADLERRRGAVDAQQSALVRARDLYLRSAREWRRYGELGRAQADLSQRRAESIEKKIK